MGKSYGATGRTDDKKELAEKVAAKVGEPPFTMVVNEGVISLGNTLRVRVFLDVQKPLVRFVPITLKERKKYRVFYAKLPDFCFYFRLMGRLVEECGDGIHGAETCDWEEWLLWNSEPLPSRPFDGRGAGSVGGLRGRMGGRGSRGGRQGRGGMMGARADIVAEQMREDMDYAYTTQNIDGGRNARKHVVSPDG